MKKVKFGEEEIELEDKDYALIRALKDLTFAIKTNGR